MKNKLWTKDFTIITVGSFISMAGNSLASFAMSLFVLDYTESTFLYALYIFLYTLPQIAAPLLSGPLMDRFSRRRTIYLLDFSIAALYLLLGLAIRFGLFSFGLFAAAVFISGTISSTYLVAFDSFYPMLISEGNYSKAYSISSVLETLTNVMIPVSTLIYNALGIFPLLVIDSALFFVAAVFETRVSDVEAASGAERPELYGLRQYAEDTKEGMRYLWSEKGLFFIALYFMILNFAGGASQVVTLPWFRGNYADGEYIYMSVWAFMVIGRAIGGLLHYKLRYPTEKKFAIALFVYVSSHLLEGFYLYTSLGLMRCACFALGILGVTSYNIRIAATQSYVPNERKGRFNGIFLVMSTVGSLLGELLGGAMAEFLSTRVTLVCFSVFGALAALVIVGGNKKHIAPIYNREV